MSVQPIDPTDPRLDHPETDAHCWSVEPGQITPQADVRPLPNPALPAGADSRLDQITGAPRMTPVEPGPTTPRAMPWPMPTPAPPAGSPSSPSAVFDSAPILRLPVVDPLLFVHVTAHSDLEQARIAAENRLRILTTTEPDDDGVMRGFGLDSTHPDVARLEGIVTALRTIEHGAELNLKRALRKCGIHPWVKAQVGLGEKQVARLLGVIGDPYWHLAEDRPRTVSELWAYSGLHVLPASRLLGDTHHDSAGGDPTLPTRHIRDDAHLTSASGNQTSDPGLSPTDAHPLRAGVAARRMKGQRANWSTEAKTRAYLIAASCIKQARSPYRATYDARRAHTAVTHPDWTAGHSHNDALRIVSKAILRDLWREAKRLHEGTQA